jgi:hypothetical protein
MFYIHCEVSSSSLLHNLECRGIVKSLSIFATSILASCLHLRSGQVMRVQLLTQRSPTFHHPRVFLVVSLSSPCSPNLISRPRHSCAKPELHRLQPLNQYCTPPNAKAEHGRNGQAAQRRRHTSWTRSRWRSIRKCFKSNKTISYTGRSARKA